MIENRRIGTIYNCNSLKVSLAQGTKGETPYKKIHDRIVIIETSKPHKITMEELAIISREIAICEDNLFPRKDGYKGRNKTFHLLKYAIQKWHWSISECCYECQLPGFEDEFGLSKDKKQRILFE